MNSERQRDSILYRELATAMAPRYSVTPAAVHLWAHRGLLPPAPTVRVRGQLAPEALAQLEALCRYRFDERINRLDWIAVLLWLDGFDVPFRVVRRVFAGAAGRLDKIDAKRPREPATEADVDRLIRRVTKFVRDVPGASGIDRDDLGDVGDELVATVGGEDASEYLRQLLARLSGTSIDRADQVADGLSDLGALPWASIAASSKADYDSARSFWRGAGLGDMVEIGRSAKPRVRVRRHFAWFLRAMQFDQFMRTVSP